MSHIVTVQTRVQNPDAISAACQRLHLPAPVQGKAELFSGEVSGLIVQLPGWEYPAVIDTQTGIVQYDNFEGHWGAQREMDRFLQSYAVEKCRLEARKKGHQISETTLQDGSIKLAIVERA